MSKEEHIYEYDAAKPRLKLNIKEILNYKDLLVILAWRDFKTLYSQTYFGLIWAFLRPLVTLGIWVGFKFVMGRDMELTLPYAVFAQSGLTVISFIRYMIGAGGSLSSSSGVMDKVYFPRLVIPLSKGLVGLIEIVTNIAILLVLVAIYGVSISINVLLVPLVLILLIMLGFTMSIWMSALTVRYRDIKFLTPIINRTILLTSPIIYPARLVPQGDWFWIYFLNPVAGIVEYFRWCFFGGELPSPYSFISFVMVFVLMVGGLFYFKKIEKVVTDII